MKDVLKALAERAIQCDKDVDDEAEDILEEDFKTLCIDQRINLLKCISNGTSVPGSDEKTIIRLIRSTPDSQVKDLFKGLESNKSELLQQLMSVVSDVGDDNYSEMMSLLVKLFQRTNGAPPLEAVYWGILKDPPYMESANVWADFQSDGTLNLQGVYTYKTEYGKDIWGPEYAKLDYKNIAPFAPISFTFISIPTQWDGANGCKVGKNYVVPAIFVYFVRDKVMKGIMQAVSWDVAQLYGGAAALKEIQTARKLWKAYATILAIGDAAGYILNSPAIAQQINTTTEGRQFLFWYNRCLLIANVGYISPFAYKFSKNLVKSYPAVKDRLKSILSKKQFDDVDNLIDDIDEVEDVVDLLDDIYDTQKAIVDQWKNNISTASNIRKGNFGEIASDAFLAEKNFQPLHTRLESIDAATRQGIDGVFKRGDEYFIVEAKYKGTATLSTLSDGTKQMSDAWINGNNRLADAVGPVVLQDINAVGYRRLLAEVSPDGSVVYKELDANANVIGIFNP